MKTPNNESRKCQHCLKMYIFKVDSNKIKYCSDKCAQQYHYNKWKSNGGFRKPEKLREYQLKVNYGISLEDFDKTFELQNKSCAICKEKNTTGKNWHVDHCHETNKNRAILCQRCNQALGLIKENVDILKTMIDYIEYHKTSEGIISSPVEKHSKYEYKLEKIDDGKTWTAPTIRELSLICPIGKDAIRSLKNKTPSKYSKIYKLDCYEK